MIRDVVIIGAGLAGSGMAATLAHRGWDVLLVERDRLPRHKVCGEFLSPEAQTILQDLGLHKAVAVLQPAPVTDTRLVSQRGITVAAPLPGCAWGVSRFALDAALAVAAQQAGAELWTGVTVKSYTRHNAGFWVEIQRGTERSTVQARTVIAACGRHSGSALPPQARNLARHQQAVGVKLHYKGITMPAQVELFFFPGGYAGINPVEGGLINVCLLASYGAFARAGKQVQGMIRQAAAWNPALAQRLAPGTAVPESAVAVAPVDLYRPAAPWTDICCLGDTATMIPPFCGDGMAMALRSAQLGAPLADQFLRGALTREQWSALYQQQWHQEFDQRLALGRRLQRLFDQPLLTELIALTGRAVPRLVRRLIRATRG